MQVFYSDDSEACHRALRVLEQVVEVEEDVVMVAHDIDTEEGRRRADQFSISTVPTTIVDGNRVIKGVPQSPGQVLGD